MDPATLVAMILAGIATHAWEQSTRRSAAAWQQARQAAADRRAARDKARTDRGKARAGRLHAAKTTGPRDPLWWPYAAGFVLAGSVRAAVAAGQGVVEGVPRGAAEGRRFGREAGRRGWRTKRAFDEYRRRRRAGSGPDSGRRPADGGGRDETVVEPCPACGVYVTTLVADPGRELGRVCGPCADWRAADHATAAEAAERGPAQDVPESFRHEREHAAAGHTDVAAAGEHPCDGTCTNRDEIPDGACPTCGGCGELVFNFGDEHGHRGCPDCNPDGPTFTRPRLDNRHEPRCAGGLLAGHRGCPDCLAQLRADGHEGSDQQLEAILIDRYDHREATAHDSDGVDWSPDAARWSPELAADDRHDPRCSGGLVGGGEGCPDCIEALAEGGYEGSDRQLEAVLVDRYDGGNAAAPVARGCDYVISTATPYGEKCGHLAVGKWHDEDDEWFCAGHMGDEDVAAEMSICPRCFDVHDYSYHRCGGCDFPIASDYLLDDEGAARWAGGPAVLDEELGERAAHEVTDPDGQRFIALTNGAESYEWREGYTVEPVIGIPRSGGFEITHRSPGADPAPGNAATNGGITTMTAPTSNNGQLAATAEGYTSTVATLQTLARQLHAAHETSQHLGEQLSADELDNDTITRINELMDTLDTAAPQAASTARHVETRHAPVADAVASAGGSPNVARKDWYDEH